MIRPYRSEDKEELLRIFNRNVPKYFDPSEVKDFENYLQNNLETYVTIESENQILGGAGYYLNRSDHSGRITWLFIDPDYAGQGLGREAVEYCLEQIKKIDGVEKLIITTSQLAYKFFEKFGFQVIRTQQNYWGEGLDLYEMKMFLL